MHVSVVRMLKAVVLLQARVGVTGRVLLNTENKHTQRQRQIQAKDIDKNKHKYKEIDKDDDKDKDKA